MDVVGLFLVIVVQITHRSESGTEQILGKHISTWTLQNHNINDLSKTLQHYIRYNWLMNDSFTLNPTFW